MGAGRGKDSKNYIEKYLHKIASVLLHEGSISSLAKEIALKENKKHRTVHSALLGHIKRKSALISSIQDDFIGHADTVRPITSAPSGRTGDKSAKKALPEELETAITIDRREESHPSDPDDRSSRSPHLTDDTHIYKDKSGQTTEVKRVTIDETLEMDPITFYDETLLRDKSVEYECETYIRYEDDEGYYLKDYHARHPETTLEQIVDKDSVIYLVKTFQDIADITCLECVRYPMALRDTPRPFEQKGVPLIGGYSLLDYVLYPLLCMTQEESVQNKRLWLLYKKDPTLRLSIAAKFSRSHDDRFERLRSALQRQR